MRECPNCKAAVADPRKLFCCERCNQIAKLVRYARRKVAGGTYDRPDIAEAIAVRRAILVEGFYDERARQVTDKVRHALLVRADGRCEKCGREFAGEGDGGFTVQHTMTEDGMILEAWCRRCNMGDAQSRLVPAAAEHLDFFVALDFRIRARRPVLQCDDPDNWPVIYRHLMAATRRTPQM